MIFGDPYEFSIGAIIVPEWSNDRFKNGLLFYFSNKMILGGGIKYSTLNTEVSSLILIHEELTCQEINIDYQNLNKDDLFEKLCDYTWGDEIKHTYLLSSQCHNDDNDFVYFVKTEFEYDRVISGNRLSGGVISECKIKKNEVLKSLYQASEYSWNS